MGGGASRWRSSSPTIGFSFAFLAGDAPPRQTTISNSAHLKSQASTGSIDGEEQDSFPVKQNLCTICLEPLVFDDDGGGGEAPKIFTAQCYHCFHLTCIASNIRHGNMTCPICRIYWHCLPYDVLAASRPPPSEFVSADPVLRILDASISNSRVNRRFSIRSTRYDDDDPTDPNSASLTHNNRLHLCLSRTSNLFSSNLLVRLAPRLPIDLVIVAIPNGSHLRLLKQAITLAVFSLRSTDRLALVTCSPTATTRAFALHRMSSHGKRSVLQVIDCITCTGETDPAEGLQKATRILEDRVHRNPLSCILNISDNPIVRMIEHNLSLHVHWFHVGFVSGVSSRFVMHEFEEFLSRVLGEEVKDVHLRIGNQGGEVRIDDLRCGEERSIPMELSRDSEPIYVSYKYKEYGDKEMIVTGDSILKIVEMGSGGDDDGQMSSNKIDARRSCTERWDYIDPFVARRWAKHLHGYRA